MLNGSIGCLKTRREKRKSAMHGRDITERLKAERIASGKVKNATG